MEDTLIPQINQEIDDLKEQKCLQNVDWGIMEDLVGISQYHKQVKLAISQIEQNILSTNSSKKPVANSQSDLEMQ